MISDYIKARLAAEIPAILTATSHLEGGRQVIRIGGASAYVGPFASDNEVEAGIRSALNIPKEKPMTVEEIKARLGDKIPGGVENLTVRVEGGRLVLSLGGPFVSVDPDITDEQLVSALLQVAPRISPPQPPLVSPVFTGTPVPRPAPAGPVTASSAHGTVRDMMEAHMRTMAQIHETQVELLRATLDRQAHAVTTAVGSVAERIEGQTDDFLAMMGQISNGL